LLLEGRDLKCPVRSAAAESVNEYQRFTLTAFQIVQREFFVAKNGIFGLSSPLLSIAD